MGLTQEADTLPLDTSFAATTGQPLAGCLPKRHMPLAWATRIKALMYSFIHYLSKCPPTYLFIHLCIENNRAEYCRLWAVGNCRSLHHLLASHPHLSASGLQV